MTSQVHNSTATKSPVSILRCVAAAATVALFSGVVDAQSFDLGGATNNRGFHQASARRNMVRHQRMLYAVVVNENGSIQIRRKLDNLSLTPWSTFVPMVNSNTTGFSSTNPTTTVAMALSGRGLLHITWGRYYYPSFFRQYYRCYRLDINAFTHPPQDITALVGSNSTTRTDSMAIATGANDQVFMTAQKGTSSWRSRLLESTWISYPVGAAPTWTNRGSISVSASSTNVRMVVDASNRVQLAFYNNTGNGQYATRVFQSPSTWSAQEQIGVPPSPRDDVGYLASDFSGFTHVLYKHLVSQVGSLINYELRYRRRVGTAAWSTPIVVNAFTSAEAAPNNPRDGFALAATQKGDRVFAIYRDYDCNRLMVKQKKYSEAGFHFLSELRPGSTVLNDYYMPSVRNTLWPTDNGLVQHLDISYREPTGTTYNLTHQRLQVGKMNVDLGGCPGSCGNPEITFAGVPCSPTAARPISIGLEEALAGAPAFLLFTLDSTVSIPFAGCLLQTNFLLTSTTVNPCCNAQVNFTLPAGCGSTWLYMQWGVPDSGATGGWSLSNRGQIQL